MTYDGLVRRADLHLRGQYPDISTEIYKLQEDSFVIYCEGMSKDFDGLKNEFDNRIKSATTPVTLSRIKPQKYLSQVSSISDKEIGKNFEGISMPLIELLNHLLGKFPDVYFYKIEQPNFPTVKVHVASFNEKIGNTNYLRFLQKGQKEIILDFLSNLNLGLPFELIEDDLKTSPYANEEIDEGAIKTIIPQSFWRKSEPEFISRDSALWYDNIDGMFDGSFTKKDLFFFSDQDYSCYVNFSLLNDINIRNHLFLYQTIYLTLPIDRPLSEWFVSQSVSENDFLELVKRGRIKVVVTNPDKDKNLPFYSEVYRVNNNAVISRKAISTLQQIDIVEISDRYIFNNIKELRELRQFCENLSNITKTNPELIFNMISWPISARRNSFEKLNKEGLVGFNIVGPENALAQQFTELTNQDRRLEFMIASSSVCIASALEATYFPFKSEKGFSDYKYASMIGELLNFFKCANPAMLNSFISNKQQIKSGILPIAPIDILEFNTYDSVLDFENVMSKKTVYPNSVRFMEYLSGLSEQERTKKIIEYNKEIEKKLSNKGLFRNVIDLGTNMAMDQVGGISGIPFFGSIWYMLSLAANKTNESSPSLKQYISRFTDGFYTGTDAANIRYLTKINRVAKINRKFL